MSEEQEIIETKEDATIVIPELKAQNAEYPVIELRLKGIETTKLSHYAAHCGVHPDGHADWDVADKAIADLLVNQTVTITGKNKLRKLEVTRIRGARIWKFSINTGYHDRTFDKKDTTEFIVMFTIADIEGACRIHDIPGYVLNRHQRTPHSREAERALPNQSKYSAYVQTPMVKGIIERGFVGGAAELLGAFTGNPVYMKTALNYLRSNCSPLADPDEPTIKSLKESLFPNKDRFYISQDRLAPKELVRAGFYVGYGTGTLDTISVDASNPLHLITSRGVNYNFPNAQAKENAILGLKTRGQVGSPWGMCRYSEDFLQIGCHRFHLPLFLATIQGEKYEPKEEKDTDKAAAERERNEASRWYNQCYQFTNYNHNTHNDESIKVFLEYFDMNLTVEEWKAMPQTTKQRVFQDRRTEWQKFFKNRQYTTAVVNARRDWATNKVKYVNDAVAKYVGEKQAYLNQGESLRWYEAIEKGALLINVNIADLLKNQ